MQRDGFICVPNEKHELKHTPTKAHPDRHTCYHCRKSFKTMPEPDWCMERLPLTWLFKTPQLEISVTEMSDESIHVDMDIYGYAFESFFPPDHPHVSAVRVWALGFFRGVEAIINNLTPSQIASIQLSLQEQVDDHSNIVIFPGKGRNK